ncbi:MAG: glutamine synthetase, partial [bacterium]|nr:glutamine synthetase [bacterium]
MDRIHSSSVPNGGQGKPLTAADFFKYAEQVGAEMVDLKFTDLLGTWQHCTFALDE